MSAWMASISSCSSSSAWIDSAVRAALAISSSFSSAAQPADAVVGLAVAQQAGEAPSRSNDTSHQAPDRAGRCSGRRTSSARRRDRRRRRDAPARRRPCRCPASRSWPPTAARPQGLADGEQVLGEVGDHVLARASCAPRCSGCTLDGLDALLRPRRRAAECAGLDLGRFVDRLALGDGLGGVDRQERRRLLAARRGGDGVGGDRAADRADRHDDVDIAVADRGGRRCSGRTGSTLILSGAFGLFEIVGGQHHDLVGRDVVLPQDHLEQFDVASASVRPRRAACRPVCSIFSILAALPWRGFAAALPLAPGLALAAARPLLGTMNTTTFLRRMATAWPFFGMPVSRRTTARSAWPLSIAAAAARRAAVEHARLQPDVGPVARELRGDRLHHAGVLAVGRADGDGQLGRLRRDMIGDGADAAAQQQRRDDDEPGVPHHDLEAAAPALSGVRSGLIGPTGGLASREQAARAQLAHADDPYHAPRQSAAA